MKEEIVELGDRVKDPISGLVGIVTAVTEFLTGCKRCSMQREGLNKDGKPYDPQHFDVPQLIVVKKREIPPKPTKKGGPRDAVPWSK